MKKSMFALSIAILLTGCVAVPTQRVVYTAPAVSQTPVAPPVVYVQPPVYYYPAPYYYPYYGPSVYLRFGGGYHGGHRGGRR